MQTRQSSWLGLHLLGPHWALGCLLLLGLGACGAVEVKVESAPPQALVHLDGHPVARTPYTFAAPYYGSVDVYASLPPEGAKGFLPAQALVPIPLPAPRLFFPFDLGLEGIQRLLGIMPKPVARLKLQRIVIPSSGVGKPERESKDEESLIQRATKGALRR